MPISPSEVNALDLEYLLQQNNVIPPAHFTGPPCSQGSHSALYMVSIARQRKKTEGSHQWYQLRHLKCNHKNSGEVNLNCQGLKISWIFWGASLSSFDPSVHGWGWLSSGCNPDSLAYVVLANSAQGSLGCSKAVHQCTPSSTEVCLCGETAPSFGLICHLYFFKHLVLLVSA